MPTTSETQDKDKQTTEERRDERREERHEPNGAQAQEGLRERYEREVVAEERRIPSQGFAGMVQRETVTERERETRLPEPQVMPVGAAAERMRMEIPRTGLDVIAAFWVAQARAGIDTLQAFADSVLWTQATFGRYLAAPAQQFQTQTQTARSERDSLLR